MSRVKKCFYGGLSITIDVSRIISITPPDHRTVFGEKYPPIEMDDGVMIKIDSKQKYSSLYKHYNKWHTQEFFREEAKA